MANQWLDRSQPQTLYMATVLFYLNAAFLLLNTLLSGAAGLSLIFALLQLFAGLGLANEKKIGYWGAVVVSILPIALIAYSLARGFGASVISLLFDIALVVLLLHPMSRSYQRIWFK
jgi:uncharacterized membrane protein (DUF2068 family)